MVATKSLVLTRIPWIIAVFSLAYISWQLIGIRFENHDDIYFYLRGYMSAGDSMSVAEDIAYRQARVGWFLSMPIYLGVNGLQKSVLFDVLNILNLSCLLVSMIYFLSSLIGRQSAILLVAVTAILFPLHYYFTFPQGYPVYSSMLFTFAFLSAGMFASHIRNPRNVKFVGSVILFTLSLSLSEYNPILHPAFLLFVYFVVGTRKDIKGLISLSWPYALGWLAYAGLYLTFSILSRNTGGDNHGRVTFSFDFVAWSKTFLVLQEKAFLPVGLMKGIGVAAEGGLSYPSLFNYLTIWNAFGSWYSAAILLFLFFVVFFVVLRVQTLSQKEILIAAAVMLTIAVVPAFVLSASKWYQKIVLLGWIQGHLTTFYSHLGLSGLVFLGCVYVVNNTPVKARFLSVFVMSVLLACYGSVTFAYNNVNRQLMMANAQKWDAMDLVVSYTRTDRPDLAKSLFYAPSFWSVNGVSIIPGVSNGNYWGSYSEYVLNYKIYVSDQANKLGDNGVRVEYFPTPEGSPIVVYGEINNNSFANLTILSSRPVAGTLFDKTNDVRLKEIARDDWVCDKYCVTHLDTHSSALDFAVGFQPSNIGPTNLIAQFFMARSSGYGVYLGNYR